MEIILDYLGVLDVITRVDRKIKDRKMRYDVWTRAWCDVVSRCERGHWSKNIDCLYMLKRQGNKFFSEGSKMNIALIIPWL